MKRYELAVPDRTVEEDEVLCLVVEQQITIQEGRKRLENIGFSPCQATALMSAWVDFVAIPRITLQ